MQLDVFVKWYTNVFRNCLLREYIFVEPKVDTTSKVTSHHLLLNFDMERETWDKVQLSIES